MEAPENSRTMVFSKGTPVGLNPWISLGGHWNPSSDVVESLLWKNDQKKARKKKTSDKMKRIIPIFTPSFTSFAWSPIEVLSR